MNKDTQPKCKTERGYDTNVICDGDPENRRTVFVTCTRHHRTVKKSFNTVNLTGKQISESQHLAFNQCFNRVEIGCSNEEDSCDS